MKNKMENVNFLRNLAFAWDLGPVDHFDFYGRVAKTYGPEYIKTKLMFVSGNFEDYMYDNRYDYMDNIINSKRRNVDAVENPNNINAIEMPVPENEYEKWLNSEPSKEYKLNQKKLVILDEYLSSFSKIDQNKLIKIMSTNLPNKNFASFMDLDPDLMTTQQFILYKDIIRFFDIKNKKENEKRESLWKYFNERSLGMENEQMNKLVSESEHEAEADLSISDQELMSIISNPSNDGTINPEDGLLPNNEMDLNKSTQSNNENDLQKQIDALREQLNKQLNISNNIFSSINSSANNNSNLNNVQTLNIGEPKIKTLLFTPQTTKISTNVPFGVNNLYAPNFKVPLVLRDINLANPDIATVKNANTIQELIAQRDLVSRKNKELVNDIINSQISYNNQFLSDDARQTLMNYSQNNSPDNNFNSASVQQNTFKPITINNSFTKANNDPFSMNKNVSVENTSDANKPISLAALINKNKPQEQQTVNNTSSINNISVGGSIRGANDELFANQPRVNNFKAMINPKSSIATTQQVQVKENSLGANVNKAKPGQTIMPYRPNMQFRKSKAPINTSVVEEKVIIHTPEPVTKTKAKEPLQSNKERMNMKNNKAKTKSKVQTTSKVKSTNVVIPSKKLV